jgi:glutamyl-tRNA synthetase
MESVAQLDEAYLQQQYAKYQNVLKGAKKGEVVTRFPPEPSGYLHIGHVKASMINYHYSRIYEGKMIVRFDDTNPAKEKDEFVQAILEDLKALGVTYTKLTHTSDYFDKLLEMMTNLIKEGKCYCDNTPADQMKINRDKGIPSATRDNTPEKNLAIWEKMQVGEAPEYCVRGKANMEALNKCMRDPVLYRCKDEPHHRTGTKYKIYPTYDFACPIVDSIEGITHTMRTNEYSDRIEQYNWVIKMTGLRPVTIYEFSRLNFVRTCLSKRKLQWFVDTGKVEGWNDPRFPTVRGILRRGLQIPTLVEFMLEQGPSKNTNLQQWDKLWALNQKHIDPIAPRYTAISNKKICTLVLVDGPYTAEPQPFDVPVHPKNTALGTRPLNRTNELYIEFEDANTLQVGEKVTLMKWGNVVISSIEPQGDGLLLKANLKEDDKDFKTTKKVNWLAKPNLVKVNLVEYDHLLTVDKVDENMDFETVINPNSKFITEALADPLVKNLTKSSVIQFERRGYYIVDNIQGEGDNQVLDLIYVPDGKTKTMSNLSTQVDVAKNILGDAKDKDAKKEKKEKKEKKKGEKPAAPENAEAKSAEIKPEEAKEQN